MSIKDLGDGRFLVRVYNRRGKEFRRVVRGKRHAAQVEAQKKAEFAMSPTDVVGGGKTTFYAFALEQINVRRLAPNTRSNYLNQLERIDASWRGLALRDIRRSDVQRLEADLFAAGLSAGTVRLYLGFAKTVLVAAEAEGFIVRSPFLAFRGPGLPAGREKIPSWADVEVLAGGRFGWLAVVLAASGLRVGEFLGLAASDVDGGLLRVRRQVVEMGATNRVRFGLESGGRLWLSDLKTEASIRDVPVSDVLGSWLSGWGGLVELPVLGHDAGLVLPLTAGGMSQGQVRRRLGCGPHGFRKLFVSTLVEAGVPLRIVQQVAGHTPGDVTSKVYARVTDGALAQVGLVLGARVDVLVDKFGDNWGF